MKCPQCGTEIQEGERFCTDCGQPVPSREEDSATRSSPGPAMLAPKTVDRPKNRLQRFLAALLASLLLLGAIVFLFRSELMEKDREFAPLTTDPSSQPAGPDFPVSVEAVPAQTLHLVQTSRFIAGDRWQWEIHLEGPADQLDQVQSVTYQLHPSFDPAARTSTDRASGFQLATQGWGTFVIPVTIYFKNGSTAFFEHQLAFQP